MFQVGGSNPSRVIPKTLEMVRAVSFLDVQHLVRAWTIPVDWHPLGGEKFLLMKCPTLRGEKGGGIVAASQVHRVPWEVTALPQSSVGCVCLV